TRQAGDRSAELARELMDVPAWMLGKLELDDELVEAITRARAVTSPNARRRAERTLAGELRRIDLAALRAQLQQIRSTGSADTARQHQAERWRARLLDEGDAAIEAFCAGEIDHALRGLVAQAQRERTTGKPPGAGRAMFRHVVEILKAREVRAAEGDPDD